jgi:5'-deoxynucleotidase YfbR-like HD superfamily hydrolase
LLKRDREMKAPYYNGLFKDQIREKRENRKERIRNDLKLYGSDVLESDEMKEAFEQTHHRLSTVGEHTLRVAASSLLLCYALKKIRVRVNLPAVVVGSLCHDLGMLGRHEKFSSAKERNREHPKESIAVAKDIVDELPEKAENIIERHMWPLGRSGAPNSIEEAVVSVADKYNAVKDVVKGSDVKNTGVKNYAKRKWAARHRVMNGQH